MEKEEKSELEPAITADKLVPENAPGEYHGGWTPEAEAYLDALIEKGTKTWEGVKDKQAWLNMVKRGIWEDDES